LLAAAEAGELDDAAGIETHARRLLADPRAADPVADFHSQWLRMDRYPNIQKDPNTFPSYDPTTPASMSAETLEFFRALILDENATYADLMTSRTTFVDSKLAALYGLQGEFGSDLTRVELDPTQRSGSLVTTRQRVEHHTSPEQCTPCHSQINAPGYAFENFDGIGVLRTMDNGAPVDTAASFANPDGGTMAPSRPPQNVAT
jgi:hypothetical protein